MNEYDVGDLVRVSASFTNATTGAAVDPTGVVCKVLTPAGVTTTYTYGTDVALVKDSTGHYHVDVSVTEGKGLWFYRFAATGTGQTADEASFWVPESEF